MIFLSEIESPMGVVLTILRMYNSNIHHVPALRDTDRYFITL